MTYLTAKPITLINGGQDAVLSIRLSVRAFSYRAEEVCTTNLIDNRSENYKQRCLDNFASCIGICVWSYNCRITAF